MVAVDSENIRLEWVWGIVVQRMKGPVMGFKLLVYAQLE